MQGACDREFGGLHAFLADCLREGWGEVLMRRRLLKLGLPFDDLGPLDRPAQGGAGRPRIASLHAPPLCLATADG